MSNLNTTPNANRLHIGFFGKRNAGKSSLVNAVTGQELSVLLSDVLGTTTDPVKKAMELLPLGPVVIIDTPGFDDEGLLGEKRVKKTKQILSTVDIAVLVVDASVGKNDTDNELIELFKTKNIPYIVAFNKADLVKDFVVLENEILVSAIKNIGVNELKEQIAKLNPKVEEKQICSDILDKNDIVVLVTPIDKSAPKGRMILPQVQTIRDVLDGSCICVVVKETELETALKSLSKKPKLVVTDSQAFGFVSKVVPKDILLTSFSILMARYKGFLETAVKGAKALESLQDGDKVLISEGCTHHRQCGDIGRDKLPKWISDYTGKKLEFDWTSGAEFKDDLSEFKLVVHCGACMLTEREMNSRRKQAEIEEIPFTNYGVIIAHINGILKRSIECFPNIAKILD